MAEAWQQQQVAKLCSSAETIQKSLSMLRIVSAKTRPGSGFVVKHPNALPAICSHLASEQLNNGEVSLQTAMNAACISRSGFSDTLKTVRAALRDEDGDHLGGVTYGTSRSSVKSAMKPRSQKKDISTTMTTPSHNRTVVFSHIPDGSEHDDQENTFPQTPTKKRKIAHPSPTKPRVSASPTKPSAEAVAAFHAAMTGNPTKRPVGHENMESQPPESGASTPRRSRLAKSHGLTRTPTQSGLLPPPSRSQGRLSQPTIRRRFRPVFLEQQQWCDRDPKVERIWTDAELYGDRLTWTPLPTVSAK